MCTATDAARKGQLSRAGIGVNGTTAAATTPAPMKIATDGSFWFTLALTAAFHSACSSAANSTTERTWTLTQGSPLGNLEVRLRSGLEDHRQVRVDVAHAFAEHALHRLGRRRHAGRLAGRHD